MIASKLKTTAYIFSSLALSAGGITEVYASDYVSVKVIAVYQTEDERSAPFEFFSSEKLHRCGGKASNRFRAYSRYSEVAERKFQLVRDAFAQQATLRVSTAGCEGTAMLVEGIGIRR
ncbi:MAG: hypothetical protein KYX62_05315 [Pseudomonadota bacterium]|nr:hypothetical protein [Pseudomonadota bacterium]